MSNWRLDIKTLFADKVVEALGDDLESFGAWNSQKANFDTEENAVKFGVWFEYSDVGNGNEYLGSLNIQQAERVPVVVTLHVMFNNYNDQAQDCAYDYAEKITCALLGVKHKHILGKILKAFEVEDGNHRAQYDYQIGFAFWVKEAVFLPVPLEDANPIDVLDPNPRTGRTLKVDLIPVINK